MGFIDIANRSLADLQQRTADFMSIQKLNSQRRAMVRELEKLHAAIGETCCRIHGEGGDPSVLEPMFEKEALLRENIALLTRETDKLSRLITCTGCGEKVSKTLNFCPRCGARLAPEATEE